MPDEPHNNPALAQQQQPPTVLEYAKPEPEGSRIGTASMICGWIAMGMIPLLFLTVGDNCLTNTFSVVWIIATAAAVFVGIIGLAQSRAVAPKDRSRARLGLTLGCINLVLLLILTILSVSGRPHPRAQRIKCASNLRQIGQAIMLYAQGKDERYPQRLDQLITASDLSPQVFVCPSSNDEEARGANMQEQLADFAKPGRCSYIYTGARLNSSSSANAVLAYEPLKNHEDDGINILFNDGHVEWIDKKQAQSVIAELESGLNPPPSLGGTSRPAP